jgi:hypothetical protein
MDTAGTIDKVSLPSKKKTSSILQFNENSMAWHMFIVYSLGRKKNNFQRLSLQ